MSDYIKREDAMTCEISISAPREDKNVIEQVVESIMNHIKNVPSADVVEVVRCKDCKYAFFKDNGVLRKTAWCQLLNTEIRSDGTGYCYFAKREDGEDNERK